MFTSRKYATLTLLSGVGVLVFATSTHARETYHAEVTAASGTVCRAQLCVACHQSPAGGGAIGQPFLNELLLAGYHFGDASSAKEAIAKLRNEETDTDNDGVLDAEEIRIATNPNSEDPAPLCNQVEYGCLRVAPHSSGFSATPWILIGVLLIRRWIR